MPLNMAESPEKRQLMSTRVHLRKQLSLIVPVGPMRNDWENMFSCIAQSISRNQLELIVVHQDYSHDSCSIWNQKFQTLCETKMICTDVEGPGAGRNRGLKVATSIWSVFWDSDDFVYIDTILEAIRENLNVSRTIIGNYETADANGTIIEEKQQASRILELGLNVGLWRMVFHTDLITAVKFPETMMAEDQVFFYRANLKDEDSQFSNQVFYQYRMDNNERLTRNQSSLQHLGKSIRIMFGEFAGVNKDLFCLLVFKQFLSLRFVKLKHLSGLHLQFLLVPKNFKLLIRGGIIYSRISVNKLRKRLN